MPEFPIPKLVPAFPVPKFVAGGPVPKVVVGLPVPKFEVGSAGAGVGLGGERDTGAPVRLRRICVSAPSAAQRKCFRAQGCANRVAVSISQSTCALGKWVRGGRGGGQT